MAAAAIAVMPACTDGAGPSAASSTGTSPSVSPSAGGSALAGLASARLVAVGDTGMDENALAVFAGMGSATADVALLLGDLSYEERESEYSQDVVSRISAPVLIVPGNHEGTDPVYGGGDGDISAYAEGIPDTVGTTPLGTGYPFDYWFDLGPARVLMISPNIATDHGKLLYTQGSEELDRLLKVIAEAKSEGRWVIVGEHDPYLTNGEHMDEPDNLASPDLAQAQIDAGVDLVLAGHDHNYSRSHSLRGPVTDMDSPTVVSRESTMRAGAGTVFVIAGNGGHDPRPIHRVDEIAAGTAIWATSFGSQAEGGIDFGYLQVDISDSALDCKEISCAGPRAGQVVDHFSISR